MYSLNKTAVYFLIFTVISSFIAYKLVIASYDSYDYASLDQFEEVDISSTQ
mgnify:CR=1 FL=1